MTDVEPRQPPPPNTDYYDQNAFAAAVTAAVEHIIAKRSGPRPILPYPLGTRSVIGGKSWDQFWYVEEISPHCFH